jgi:sugar lactone lactonase YvrE
VGLLVGCGGSDPVTPVDGGTGDTGPACPATGTGTVVVNVSGLPAGASAKVVVTGPSGPSNVDATKTITGAGAGTYTVTADKVIVADPIVRTVYTATISSATFCLGSGLTQTLTVTYAAIPTSNKLWVTNGPSNGTPLGFASASLAASGSPAATVAATSSSGRDVTFDQDGNLWSFGGTDSTLQRFPAGSMGTSGAKTADRTIDLKIACVPPTTGLAFDKNGNLWVSSSCSKKVFRVTSAQLGASGDAVPAVYVTTPKSAAGIAFDKSGNLWVSDPDDAHLLRFDASSLSASTSTPSLTMSIKTSNSGEYKPSWLAFDATGNLWGNDFGGNVIFKLTPADQAGTAAKDVTPGVAITLSVGALLEGMAFDEGGGLWTAFSAGKFARIAPADLGTSTNAGNPTAPGTLVSSADVGYVGNLAFYPAPAALPLYHALP